MLQKQSLFTNLNPSYMKILYHKIIVIVSVLLIPISFSSSCEKKSGNEEYSSLEKALGKATEIINTQMPGAKLAEILGIEIDQNGHTTTDGEWTFYYFKEAGENYEYYAVSVPPNGDSYYWDPGGAICHIEIPSYLSASMWVSTADNIIGNQIQFDSRSVQVFADFDDFYPGVDFTVYIYYLPPNGDNIAYIILDADTNNTLLIEDNP